MREPTLTDLLERLDERGWRLTPQRRAVASAVDGENLHLSADAIYARARVQFPEISIATVYNTLNELVAMGEILEVGTGSGPKRYDANTRHAHHHLVCTTCGALQDVAPTGREPRLADEERRGYVITGVDIVFQGLCPTCRAIQDR